MLDIRLDLSELEGEHKRVSQGIADACLAGVLGATSAGVVEARRVAGWQDRTGAARRSIKRTIIASDAGGTTGRIEAGGATAPYAPLHETGTRPHEIRARRVPDLVFWWEKVGALFVGKKVNHPGTRPYPFMGPAYLAAERRLRAVIEGALAKLAG